MDDRDPGLTQSSTGLHQNPHCVLPPLQVLAVVEGHPAGQSGAQLADEKRGSATDRGDDIAAKKGFALYPARKHSK